MTTRTHSVPMKAALHRTIVALCVLVPGCDAEYSDDLTTTQDRNATSCARKLHVCSEVSDPTKIATSSCDSPDDIKVGDLIVSQQYTPSECPEEQEQGEGCLNQGILGEVASIDGETIALKPEPATLGDLVAVGNGQDDFDAALDSILDGARPEVDLIDNSDGGSGGGLGWKGGYQFTPNFDYDFNFGTDGFPRPMIDFHLFVGGTLSVEAMVNLDLDGAKEHELFSASKPYGGFAWIGIVPVPYSFTTKISAVAKVVSVDGLTPTAGKIPRAETGFAFAANAEGKFGVTYKGGNWTHDHEWKKPTMHSDLVNPQITDGTGKAEVAIESTIHIKGTVFNVVRVNIDITPRMTAKVSDVNPPEYTPSLSVTLEAAVGGLALYTETVEL